MEIDSPSERNLLSPQDRILQRLVQCGVPDQYLNQLQRGLVAFMKENKYKLTEVVYAILPTDKNVMAAILEVKSNHGGGGASRGPTIKEQFCESMMWLKWLMFEDEPVTSMKKLTEGNVGQRGVCGAVWGQNDIAYRCRTCEHDPTCAICVPCFQNGSHKDHDYSLMYTGGGCCDCGDVTAWKREGFCSKHKGAEQIKPLPEETADSVGPVLDVLLICWKEKLVFAQTGGRDDEWLKIAKALTYAIVEMLLEFCKYSESLLSFVSRRVFSSVGLLDVLVRAERFLSKSIVGKLHELLLKLLGEPTFKYEFAKVFIKYYPDTVKEVIKERSDSVLDEYPLLSTFSVQILTVPTLTPRLVKEMNLLGILLGCLEDIFVSCAEEGRLQVSRWAGLYETTIRLVEDTRYVMSHFEIPKYVTLEQPDISRTWIQLLNFVQAMNPQKRIAGVRVEEENETMHNPFVLGDSIAKVHSLLVAGAFSIEGMKFDLDDSDSLRHTKVGRLSQESSVCGTTGRTSALDGASPVPEVNFDTGSYISLVSSVTLLTDCLRAIGNWLEFNVVSTDPMNFLSPDTFSSMGSNFLALKKTSSRISKGRSTSKVYRAPSARGRLRAVSELHDRFDPSPIYSGFDMDIDLETECASGGSDDNVIEKECVPEREALGVLSFSDWPDITYDVSSQDISLHIPLHRLLSMLLQKALNKCYGESGAPEMNNPGFPFPLPGHYNDFFGKVLGGCHPHGFSAFVMEHPLRIRVFCAQVRAGMWRKNGDTAILSCEWYRSVRWSEQGLELDLFLLQCCASLAPPDLYVERILERFGLSSYLSLNLEQSNEYEPVLVQEMLTLIIQIVKERHFCGLSTAESLKRELIYKLAIADATRSQLVKYLPHDLSKNDKLQKILDEVAVYANPSGMKQGKYSLRKIFWKELDLYHPRWNSRELQVAEERYLWFCKVSALTSQLPKWTKVFYPLSGISRIATSRAVLKIVRAVLFYAVFTDKSSSSRAPDGVLITALHLLSLALDICYLKRQSSHQSCGSTSRDLEDSLPMLACAGEEIVVESPNESGPWKQQSLLSLLVSLMRMHKKENVNNFVEAGQCDLSSLIENLLKKFVELNVDCLPKLQRLAPEVVCHLSQPIPNGDIPSGSTSDVEDRKAKARERQAAILEKMRAAQSKFMASLKSTSTDEVVVSKSKEDLFMSDNSHVSEELAPVVCSLCRDPDSKNPVSFLILLQKSRLVSFVERGPPSWEQVHLSDNDHLSITASETSDSFGRNILSSSPEMISSSHLVQLVQNAVNEFTHVGLPSEVDAFLHFIKERLAAARNIHLPSISHDTYTNTASSIEMMENDIFHSILKDVQDILLHSNVMEDEMNISTSHTKKCLTQSRDFESILLGKYISSLAKETSEHPPASKSSRSENAMSKTSIQYASFDGFGPTDCNGIHISSCGHAVHRECRDRYLSSLRERHVRRIVFEGGQVVDPDQGEFLCPVCRRLANSVLPAFPGDSSKVGKQIMLSDLISEQTTGSSITSGTHVLRLTHGLTLLQTAANMVGKGGIQKTFSQHRNEIMRQSLEPVFRLLCKMYFPDRLDKLLASERVSHSMILWDTLKYSLISTEIAARGARSNMCTGGSMSSLEALNGELESSSGFILSLLLQVVQSTRSENCLQVLLRFRGIQLFAGSICSCVSIDDFSTSRGSRRGNISAVLKHIDKGVVYPDIQFWKRAADPVLAHDPFSSLMWILFSLPYPFLSSAESFLSLVHLFYVVCVVQALITCCGKNQYDTTELGFGDCLIDDICKIKSVVAQQYFVSNHIGSSCHPKDMIRRLSHPYLRRCALLWKLLKSSMSAPFCARSRELDRSSSRVNDDMFQSDGHLSMELKDVEELEHMFQIPKLDVVLKDKVLRALSLKWFHHFCKEFEVRNYGHALHSTPAVPFRLMCLPYVYQDLLERYIKRQCPECKAALDELALCLLCGRLCSPTWKSCCRESGCQTHAMSCGAGIGVFLLIRKTTILLQRSARQAPWPSPYLDDFGEEDIDMHRGKPLYLNEERYAALTHMVASHGLDRSSEVLRQTTMDSLFLI